MGVVKTNKKSKKHDNVNLNGKQKKDDKVKKKKKVSCLQCFKSPDDGGLEGKYRVAAPELMQDTFMSDSEDEGGEVECPIQQQQQYRYMNSEAGTLNRARPLEDSVTDGHLWPSNNDSRVATIERQPLDIGFLVSFVVDARGGAMKAKRRGGVRVIVPPAACAAPTRVTCRAATRRAPAAAPPPLMEGEALASRLLELQPQGAKFLAPVIIEVPIFTASCPEREIVILRSDTGETWQDHYLHNNDNPMIQEALTRERQDHGNSGESLGENGERVTRIITCDFPHYLAVVSRVRQEVHIIGPEGGTISSAHIPQVQALFPPQALTKRIRVGLQAHGANSNLCRRVLPRHAAVSPVLTVEPRRRKFHRSITLTAPLPHPADQKINSHDKQSTANLRLLCSIMGGQARAVWEDVTGSTPLTITDDCASFTTTVSARFWLMNCQNVSDATKLATELYREMLLVPFEVRIVVLGKRLDALEGRLLVLYITDRYAYDTLLHQEHYTEVAHSTAVRFLDGKPIYLEFSGNLVPVTKSGTQPTFTFEGFKDNRVEFTVRVKHHEETPSGRIYFMNEPKVAKGEQQASPACVLDVSLPERIAPRAAKSHLDCLNLDQSGFDALKDELSFHWGDHNHSVGPPSIPHDSGLQINGHDKTIANGNVKYSTKDTENKDAKPQVNGDTQHDSNKTKATFDSDEDKTPMNTLEKGKKKSEGGFLGGLADKVKNVFNHSDDRDDSKESSPKPQPKPRESKEKTPPKPAPRLINEDLLEKVEDMFKDVHSKPHLKDDDDVNNQLYTTKLIVDEEEFPKDIRIKTDEVYHQYEHMQPVDTPLHCKTSDPFQFHTGCCEGRYKKGEKHRHDETSNWADRIEQVAFSAHEISGSAGNDLKDNLEKVTKEKDNLKQQVSEVKEDIIVRSENLKNNLINKNEELRTDIQDNQKRVNNAINDLSQATNDTQARIVDVQTKVSSDIANVTFSADDSINNFVEAIENTKENANNKFHELDFAAMERAEEMRLRGNDKLYQLGKTFDETAEDINLKSQDGANIVSDKINDIQNESRQTSKTVRTDLQKNAESVTNAVNNVRNDINNQANNIIQEAEDTVDDIQRVANDKINELNVSLDVAKAKGQKAVSDVKSKGKNKKEKKSKEGKNFFSGLVHNIFGEKDKIEDEVKGKIAEGKESADKLTKQASDAKNEFEENISKEGEKLKQNAAVIAQNVQDKKDELSESAKVKTEEIIKNTKTKTDELSQTLQNKTNEVVNTAQDTKDLIIEGTQRKKDELLEDAQERTDGLIQIAQKNKDDLIQNVQEKKDDLVLNLQESKHTLLESLKNEKDEVIQNTQNATKVFVNNIQENTENVKNYLRNKKDDILHERDEVVENVHNKKDELLQTANDTTEGIVKSVRDKKDELVQRAQNETEEANKSLQKNKDELVQNVQDKTLDIVKNVDNKKNEIVQNVQDKTNEIGQSVQEKKDELEHTLNSTKDEIGQLVQSKTEQGKKKLEDTKANVKFIIDEKTDELLDAKNTAQEEADERLKRIREEAEQTTEEIKRTAEETLNAAANKKSEIENNISKKFSDIKNSGMDEVQRVHQAASDKGSELQKSAKATFSQIQDSASSAFDTFESAAKDKVNDAKETYDDLQSSAKDTFADFKDDVHGLESSTQDTLRSFQSSAGNTFDSLDESAREIFGSAQNTGSNAKESAKELFGNVSDSFEGFQVAAGDKLEDIKGTAKNRLEGVDESWEKTKEGVKESEEVVADTLANEADKFTSSLNDLGNSVFGMSGKGFMKDSSTKLLESEKSQSSPHKKSSGFFSKLRRNP